MGPVPTDTGEAELAAAEASAEIGGVPVPPPALTDVSVPEIPKVPIPAVDESAIPPVSDPPVSDPPVSDPPVSDAVADETPGAVTEAPSTDVAASADGRKRAPRKPPAS
jgi:hypothetical protein